MSCKVLYVILRTCTLCNAAAVWVGLFTGKYRSPSNSSRGSRTTSHCPVVAINSIWKVTTVLHSRHIMTFDLRQTVKPVQCVLFCSLAVLNPRFGHTMNVLSPFISFLCHFDWLFHAESTPVDVLMLSIQAVRGLPRLSAPGIVPCITSFFSPGNSISSWCDHSRLASLLWQCLFTPALLRTHSFVFFAVHETRRIFLCPCISKASKRVFSFFLRVQLSQRHIATQATFSAFISRIFVEIGMMCLFRIFCSDAPIACPLFSLVWNSVVHSPSSVIRDPRYRNVSICSSCSLWMSMRHAMPSLATTPVLSTLMSGLYLRLTRSIGMVW